MYLLVVVTTFSEMEGDVMNGKKKRVLAFTLLAMMVFVSSIPAFGAGIELHGVTPIEDLAVVILFFIAMGAVLGVGVLVTKRLKKQ